MTRFRGKEDGFDNEHDNDRFIVDLNTPDTIKPLLSKMDGYCFVRVGDTLYIAESNAVHTMVIVHFGIDVKKVSDAGRMVVSPASKNVAGEVLLMHYSYHIAHAKGTSVEKQTKNRPETIQKMQRAINALGEKINVHSDT